MIRDVPITIQSLTPELLKREGPALAEFINVYYEWLKEETSINQTLSEYRYYQDIDLVSDSFLDFLSSEFLVGLPENVLVDKRRLIKNIKDFYMAKGTEKATRLLFRILFDEEITFYYPKVDILRTSHGVWVVEKSISVIASLTAPGLALNDIVVGTRSNARARVTRWEPGIDVVPITKVYLSNIAGEFEKSEQVLIGDEVLGIISSEGITNEGGRYDGTNGFLSSDKKLQDGYYYQEYSYEVTSSRSLTEFKDPMYNLVHPSGTKLFANVLLEKTVGVESSFEVQWNFDEAKEFDYSIDFGDIVSISSNNYLVSYEPILDFPALTNFNNITSTGEGYTGEASVFVDPGMAEFEGVALSNFENIPLQYLGTKRLVIGDPLFTDGPAANTNFESAFIPGGALSFDGSNYYTVQEVYNDHALLLSTNYIQPDIFSDPYFGREGSNNVDLNIIIANDSQIVLDFDANTYMYFDQSQPQEFVFRNYGGPRNPVNVGVSNTFNIPVLSGNYTSVVYTYSNSSIYTHSNVTITFPNDYTYAATPKGSDVTKIVFNANF